MLVFISIHSAILEILQKQPPVVFSSVVFSTTLIKRDYNTGVFLSISLNFEEHLFEEHLRIAASNTVTNYQKALH